MEGAAAQTPTTPAPTPPSPPPTPAAANAPAAPAQQPPSGAAASTLPDNFKSLPTAEKLKVLREKDVQEIQAESAAKKAERAEKAETKAKAEAKAEAEKPEAPKPEAGTTDLPAPKAAEAKEAPVEAQEGPEEEPEAPKAYSKPETLLKALDAIPDPKLRSELKHHLRLAKDYRELMPISEVKARRGLHPTLESAQAERQMVEGYATLQRAFLSGTPEGQLAFVARLHEESPEATASLVRNIAAGLDKIDVDAYKGIAIKGFRNVLSWARQIEETTGKDPQSWSLAELAQIVQRTDGRQQGPPPNHPLVQENRRLQEQMHQQAAAQVDGFFGQALYSYGDTLAHEADSMLQKLDPQNILPPEGRDRLLRETLDAVAAQVRANPVVSERTKQLLRSGRLDQQHTRAIVDHLMSHARPLLAQALADANGAYMKELRYAQQRTPRPAPLAAVQELPIAAPTAPLAPKAMPPLKGSTADKIRAMRAAGVR